MTNVLEALDDGTFEAQLREDLKDDEYEAKRRKGRGGRGIASKKRSIRKHMLAIKKLRNKIRQASKRRC